MHDVTAPDDISTTTHRPGIFIIRNDLVSNETTPPPPVRRESIERAHTQYMLPTHAWRHATALDDISTTTAHRSGIFKIRNDSYVDINLCSQRTPPPVRHDESKERTRQFLYYKAVSIHRGNMYLSVGENPIVLSLYWDSSAEAKTHRDDGL